ncbi:LuxR C-terminal-related transcriptional regulator [Nocardia xishanensis]|uniref:LuxR C-terminal-related transcriptional regulator n=1 Tax=Nocardia xishanensis TaxID=238964 RepID=UPI0033FA5FCB
MRGETAEFNDLAQFLRDQVGEARLTLKQLEEFVGTKTTAISQRLSGVGLTREFVIKTITACTEHPRARSSRERQMATALRLWDRATAMRTLTPQVMGKTPDVSNALAVERGRVIESQAENLELYRRMKAMQDELDLVSRSALKARTAEHEAVKLSMVLSICLWRLAGEIERLKVVRNSAITAIPVDENRIQAIDTNLMSVKMRHARSRRDLTDANEKRERAVQLLAAAIARRQQLTEEIRRLANALGSSDAGNTPAETLERIEDWQIEFDLDEVDSILDRIEDSARSLTEQIEAAAVNLKAATTGEVIASVPRSDRNDNARLRIGMVDIHESQIYGLRAILAETTDLSLVAASGTVGELLAITTDLDLVVLDLQLSDGSTPRTNVERLRAAGIEALVMTSVDDPELVLSATHAGVLGVVRKSGRIDELTDAIRNAANGRTFMNRAAVLDHADLTDARLSPRQREVLRLYASGAAASHIAHLIGLAPDTVHLYLARIRAKYAEAGRPARTKLDLYKRAVEDGLLDGPRRRSIWG